MSGVFVPPPVQYDVVGIGSNACAVRVRHAHCTNGEKLDKEMSEEAVLMLPFNKGNDIVRQQRVSQLVDPIGAFTPKFQKCTQSPEHVAMAVEKCRLALDTTGERLKLDLTPKKQKMIELTQDLSMSSQYATLQQFGGYEATRQGMQTACRAGYSFSIYDLVRAMPALFRAVEDVSKHGFMHMDIRPPNILLQFNKDTKRLGKFLIIDFANARTPDEFHALPVSEAVAAAVNPYMPPEVLAAAYNSKPCVKRGMMNPLTHCCVEGCGCSDTTRDSACLFNSYITYEHRLLQTVIKPLYTRAGIADRISTIQDALTFIGHGAFIEHHKQSLLLDKPVVLDKHAVNVYGLGLTLFEIITSATALLFDQLSESERDSASTFINGVIFDFFKYVAQPMIHLLPSYRALDYTSFTDRITTFHKFYSTNKDLAEFFQQQLTSTDAAAAPKQGGTAKTKFGTGRHRRF